MPESRYAPDNEDLNRKTTIMEEVLTLTRDALVQFMISLPAPDQVFLAQEASLPFLKDLDVIKNHIAAKATGENEEQEEEDDTDTVINGEDGRNDNKVPIDNDLTGDGSGDPVVDAQGDNVVPTPPPSPRNSQGSSKSLRIEGRSYQIHKERIKNLLSNLEADNQLHHSKHLEKQANLLSTMLKDMDIKNIISIADTEPDFLSIFSETEDQINDWRHATKFRIKDLMI